jgi:hypothetical protein
MVGVRRASLCLDSTDMRREEQIGLSRGNELRAKAGLDRLSIFLTPGIQ